MSLITKLCGSADRAFRVAQSASMANVASMISRMAPAARLQGAHVRPHCVSLRRDATAFLGVPMRMRLPQMRTVHVSPIVAMAKKSVGDLTGGDLKGKTVFVRADLNVPLDGELNITDDTRVRAAVPTLEYLVKSGAKVLLTSHLGRPKSGPEDKFRLNPVVPRLTELLGSTVKKVDDCIGDTVKNAVNGMSDGEVTHPLICGVDLTLYAGAVARECAFLSRRNKERCRIF